MKYGLPGLRLEDPADASLPNLSLFSHYVIRTQHGLLERCFLRRCSCTDLTGTRPEAMNQPRHGIGHEVTVK